MVTETIEYVDYDGVEREEKHYFNLNQNELVKLQRSVPGGLEKMLKDIIAAKDEDAIMEVFEKLLHISYGKKSPDGKQFIKSEEITKAFEETLAYDKLYMELITNADRAAAFVNQVINNANLSKVPSLDQK